MLSYLDSQRAHVRLEEGKIKKLMQQMESLDVYGLSGSVKGGQTSEATQMVNLVSVAAKGSLELHIKRSNYQAKIWINAYRVEFCPTRPEHSM